MHHSSFKPPSYIWACLKCDHYKLLLLSSSPMASVDGFSSRRTNETKLFKHSFISSYVCQIRQAGLHCDIAHCENRTEQKRTEENRTGLLPSDCRRLQWIEQEWVGYIHREKEPGPAIFFTGCSFSCHGDRIQCPFSHLLLFVLAMVAAAAHVLRALFKPGQLFFLAALLIITTAQVVILHRRVNFLIVFYRLRLK